MRNFEEYKPLEPEYNIRVAVENLRKAYWSNEPEKVAKDFTEAENIIISAICHHGYTVFKERPQGEWKVYGRQGDIPITDYCSNCKYEMKWYRNKYKFCPNCGAKMKGGAE